MTRAAGRQWDEARRLSAPQSGASANVRRRPSCVLLAHDLVRKPVPIFRDHALYSRILGTRATGAVAARLLLQFQACAADLLVVFARAGFFSRSGFQFAPLVAYTLARLFLFALMRRQAIIVADQRRVEVGARFLDDLLAQFGAQRRRLDFLGGAFRQIAQHEGPEGDADQPVHAQPERLHDFAHFSVFALADGKHQPRIGALHALERRLDRPVVNAFD